MVLNINNLSYCKDVFLSVYHGFGIIFLAGRLEIQNFGHFLLKNEVDKL